MAQSGKTGTVETLLYFSFRYTFTPTRQCGISGYVKEWSMHYTCACHMWTGSSVFFQISIWSHNLHERMYSANKHNEIVLLHSYIPCIAPTPKKAPLSPCGAACTLEKGRFTWPKNTVATNSDRVVNSISTESFGFICILTNGGRECVVRESTCHLWVSYGNPSFQALHCWHNGC